MSLDREIDKPCWYQFKVRGHLDESWSEWFEGLVITPGDDDTTELNGIVADQAALYGLLIKMRDLNLTLVAISREGDLAVPRDRPLKHDGNPISMNTGGKDHDKEE